MTNQPALIEQTSKVIKLQMLRWAIVCIVSAALCVGGSVLWMILSNPQSSSWGIGTVGIGILSLGIVGLAVGLLGVTYTQAIAWWQHG